MKKGPHSPNLSPLVRVLNIPPLLVLMEVVEIQSDLYIRKMGFQMGVSLKSYIFNLYYRLSETPITYKFEMVNKGL